MIRKATPFATALVAALLSQAATASELSLVTLDKRLHTLESRVDSIQASIGKSREKAMMDATLSSSTYVIKEGDTLGDIARKHSVPRNTLLEANNLREGQPIYIGETLVIPAEPGLVNNGTVSPQKPDKAPSPPQPQVTNTQETPKPQSTYHKVAPGDTLHSISRRYNTTVVSLQSANGLRNTVISTGQRLLIPTKGGTQQTQTVLASADTAPQKEKSQSADMNELLNPTESYGYYTVLKGDNLYALSRDFFTSMPELQRLNRLGKSTLIHPGDELIVPTSKYNSYHNNVAKN